MLALAAALLLTQTYPLMTNQTITIASTGSAQISNIGSGSVSLLYQQSGAAQGNLTLSLIPLGPNGQFAGAAVTHIENPSIGTDVLTIAPFTGTAVVATWTVSSPNDSFASVNLNISSTPYSDGGGGGGGSGNACPDGGVCAYRLETDGTLAVLGDAGANGNVSAFHFTPSSTTPVPNVFTIAINQADGGLLPNPFDGGIILTTGSTDQAGTIAATVSNVHVSGGVSNVPYLCLEPGGAVGPGYRCRFTASDSLSATLSTNYWAMDAGLWDAGDTLPDFCLQSTNPITTGTVGVYTWDYICGGG